MPHSFNVPIASRKRTGVQRSKKDGISKQYPGDHLCSELSGATLRERCPAHPRACEEEHLRAARYLQGYCFTFGARPLWELVGSKYTDEKKKSDLV
ncbi:hypothetical protein PoB_007656500 [Plakobranchus ocellatus]|uniref:Uncharacterized protein n=1 Tax=Plakobranchus ocellatus TaxID=259542 RepID=A0AAV4E1D2_9GAST|nr:hypothetical protein PoB_007656500 [Plakobranchus ocellatus]